MTEQAQLTAWTAGFTDSDGTVCCKINDRPKIVPSVQIKQCYHAGVFDGDGVIISGVQKNDDCNLGHQIRPGCEVKQNITDCPIQDKLCEFADSLDIEYNLYHREYDDNQSDTFTFTITNKIGVKTYLKKLEPHLVVKKEQAQIMLQEILPRLERGDHHSRRGFLKTMKYVDMMNELKGGNRGKYNVEYFEDKWGMTLNDQP